MPETDETVATGAAVQAAVCANDATFDEIPSIWSLKRTQVTAPRADSVSDGIREQYRSAASFDDGLCRPAATPQ